MGTNVKVLMGLAVLALAAWGGWEWRDRSADLEMSELLREQAKARQQWDSDMLDISIDLARTAIERDKARSKEARVITKEVIRYVQNPDAGTCTFPDDGVLLYDRAWRNAGTVSGDGVHADPAARISDIEILQAATHNAAACGEIRAALLDWQRAWHAVEAKRER